MSERAAQLIGTSNSPHYRMSRLSGSGSPIKDMRKYKTLLRIRHSVDNEMIHYERDAL